MQLRPYQQQLTDGVRAAWAAGNRVVLMQASTGAGKCLGRGTPVLMADGSTRLVELVNQGDSLMGPDGSPRHVLSICRGREALYRVVPTKGEPFVCNESHILSLVETRMGEIVNISVREYLSKSRTWRHVHKGYRAPEIPFPPRLDLDESDIPPYMLGVWLGDGSSDRADITTADCEILEYLWGFASAKKYDVSFKKAGGKSFTVSLRKPNNPFRARLRLLGILHNKHIPHSYKTASVEQRLQLLAGLMDTDGGLSRGGYDYISKSRQLADGVAWVARSLGLAAYVSSAWKSCNGGPKAEYFRVSISGDCWRIPCKLARKKAPARKQKKNALRFGFTLEPLGEGDYFGFEITGDKLFVLGDFTVTHNTPMLADVLNHHDGFSAVLVHRDKLVEQISLTLARGGVRHDLIASDKTKRIIARKHVKKLGQCFYSPGARARVASVQTLVKAKGLEKWLSQVTLWIGDEGHHFLAANSWGTCVSKFTHPACHGLLVTATPGRPDGKGLGRHADGFADVMIEGPPMRWLIDEGYLCDYDVVCPPSDLIAREAPKGSDGDYTSTQRRDAERNSHIVGDVPAHYVKWASGKSGITFCGTIETATATVEAYRALGVSAELITGDTDPTIRDDIFDRAEHGQLNQIVAVDVISEGFDCLDEETEILTPKGWKKFDDISEGDDCYSLNIETEKMEITPILAAGRRYARPDERIWTVKSQHTNIRVTDGHLIYFQAKHPRKPEGRGGEWRVQTAEAIHERQQPFVLPLSAEMDFPGLPLSNDEMHLLGWFLSDGYLGHGKAALSIGQSKPEGIAQIRDLLGRLGWDYSIRIREPKSGYGSKLLAWEFLIPKGNRGGSLKRKGWGHLAEYIRPDKSLPEKINLMTREQFQFLWKGLMEGDGSNKEKGRVGSLTCGRKEHADIFTHLACVRGFAVGFGKYKSTKGVDIFNIRVRDRKWMFLAPKDIRGAKYSLEPADPKETFWCVRNRNGTIVTRRHGKIAILGNCPSLQVGSFARLTGSVIIHLQQVGRILRPTYAPGYDLETREGRLAAIAASNKPRALLLDHTGSFVNPSLGPPDKPRIWTLDRREKRAAQEKDPNDIPLRVCTNPAIDCFKPYPRIHRACPYCGFEPQPAGRAAPEQVEGDLQMLDPAALAALRGAVIDPTMSRGAFDAQQLAKGAQSAWLNRHWSSYVAAGTAQILLRASMDDWAGQLHARGLADHEIQRAFWLGFGVDVLSAQALGEKEAIALKERIDCAVNGT